MKKIIVVLLLLAMLWALFVGCSQKQQTEKKEATEEMQTTPADTSTAPATPPEGEAAADTTQG